jgi:hypothetical protein
MLSRMLALYKYSEDKASTSVATSEVYPKDKAVRVAASEVYPEGKAVRVAASEAYPEGKAVADTNVSVVLTNVSVFETLSTYISVVHIYVSVDIRHFHRRPTSQYCMHAPSTYRIWCKYS